MDQVRLAPQLPLVSATESSGAEDRQHAVTIDATRITEAMINRGIFFLPSEERMLKKVRWDMIKISHFAIFCYKRAVVSGRSRPIRSVIDSFILIIMVKKYYNQIKFIY